MTKRTEGGAGSPNINTSSLIRTSRTTPHSREYGCPKYQPATDSKRCRHYAGDGACALPDELMCVEWLRANPQPIPSSPSVSPVAPARGLFELQVQEQQPKTSPPFSPSARIDGERMPLTAIPADDLAALKSAGVEVQLHVGGGAIHLVPEYTRRSRIELTFEHAATLRRLLDAFPGARIAELGRIPRSAKETVMNVQPAKEVH